MPSRRRTSIGPAWLLVVAWACANLSPSATCVIIAWLTEASSFSHQQRLTEATAYLLAGQQPPSLLAKIKQDLPKPAAPSLPAELAGKKVELAFEAVSEFLPGAQRALGHFVQPESRQDRRRGAPPHEPPRAA